MSIHTMAAAYFDVAELALEDQEARAIAQAIAEVNKHYKIPGINPAHAALLSLAVVVFTIYGKRVPLIIAAKKTKSSRAAPVATAPAPATATPAPAAASPPNDDWFTATAAPVH